MLLIQECQEMLYASWWLLGTLSVGLGMMGGALLVHIIYQTHRDPESDIDLAEAHARTIERLRVVDPTNRHIPDALPKKTST